MPTARDHIPGGPTAIARRLDALEREVRELRAARRATHTALSTGALQLTDAAGDVVAEMTPDFAYRGQSAFAAYDTRGDQEFYAALAAGDLAFGIAGETALQDEARITYGRISETDIVEMVIKSGNLPGISPAQLILYSESAVGANDSSADVLIDRINLNGTLTARNIAYGSTSITPSAAGVPTSLAVGGLALPGTTFIVTATAATAVPGSQVTGVGVTGATATGFTLWLTRTSTTATTVNWMVMSK
ncbi:hypothetical protein [Streptomyces liangshanensis]|uniref:hypothetical protein n=1 Tax=Streptomyces liangshanensis TaxID=2717324 RepID=UPI0036DEB172